ncbi:MAG: carbamoyltransferase HypF [Nitrososphaeria archaeon]
MRSRISVSGIVQGVGFRPFVYRTALKNSLTGYAKNMGDGTVEIEVEGERENIDKFVKDLYFEKPKFSRIDTFKKQDFNEEKGYSKFVILKSEHKERESASLIPPDLGICEDCARELFDPRNRRFGYHFITCTNCGPRYTIIERHPYDKRNTTMRDFSMCKNCAHEYENPMDRRFHAETIACKVCGPFLKLYNKDGIPVTGDPIINAANLIDLGKIVAIKGIGGFHIALSAYLDDSIAQLRKWKHREQKPFAVMAKDLNTVKEFAEVKEEEERLLSSAAKPIVLLKLKKESRLSKMVSPGLHNIGVMLPYSGVHLLLFSRSKTDVYIMTSGNLPSEPIVAEEKEAIKKFSNIVDFFLIHNRRILHRCDDSVIRKVGDGFYFIRRSRGYTPEPLNLEGVKDTIGLGAEQNVAGCVISSNRAYLTQYIGDVENLETLDSYKYALTRILRLSASKPIAIAHDLHPTFNTTVYAQELSKEKGIPNFPIQHHHAHIASIMAENELEQSIGIALDGYGYGSDKNAWGGEILLCDRDKMIRVGHLEEQPYLGGDLAAKYPARMVLAILSKLGYDNRWASANLSKFPYGAEEIKILSKKLKSRDYILTSSTGRILDAISTLLDVCDIRTYEGEPAMKLESFALNAKGTFKVDPVIEKNTVKTTRLIEEIFLQLGKVSPAELAYAGEEYLARGISELAAIKAREHGVKDISISGGVFYNEHISRVVKDMIESNELKLHKHKYAPPGDGCISLGQAYVVGKWIMK